MEATRTHDRAAQLVALLERHALENPGLAQLLLLRVELIRLSSLSVH